MMIQPIVSSMMAEATMTWPTLRRMKFISRTTMATIFTEEIDSAVPRNSEVISRSSRIRQHSVGQHFTQREAAGEWNENAGERNGQRGALHARDGSRSVSMPVSRSNIRMPSFDTASSMAFCGKRRKQHVLDIRREQAEHGRAQHHARQQLSHDRRLPDAMHQLAEDAPDDEQQHHFDQEADFRSPPFSAAKAGEARAISGAAASRRRMYRDKTGPLRQGTVFFCWPWLKRTLGSFVPSKAVR